MFAKIRLKPYMCQLLFIFLIDNQKQNVHNGKFSNVNNEFIVTNVFL